MAPDTLERERPRPQGPVAAAHAVLRRRRAGCDADDGATHHVVNPATGRADRHRAGAAAPPRRGARSRPPSARWPAWRAKTAKERSAILRKWFELMLAQRRRPRADPHHRAGQAARRGRRARSTIGAAYVEWFAEEGKRVYGDVIPTIGNDRRLVVIKQPVGVCAAITPWNFPCVDDHAQGRAGARRRLHRRHQARRRRRRTRRWRWPSSRIAPASRRACST